MSKLTVVEHPLSWYVEKLKNNDHFSLGRYGDGAWIAINGRDLGKKNAEGSVFTEEMGKMLKDSLEYKSSNYYLSTPAIIHHPELKQIKAYASRATQRPFIDCDVWDREARVGGLVPFIQQIQKMKTCIISNTHLRGLNFLGYDHFVEIPMINCLSEIDRVIDEVKQIGNNCVYLVSAGQPAVLITQKIHALFPHVFALDVGSIWDAFVRIGGQRGWRRQLYENADRYQAWKNLYAEVMIS